MEFREGLCTKGNKQTEDLENLFMVIAQINLAPQVV
jgi:hypothetical protein